MDKGQFWLDLEKDLEDPEFRKHYEEATQKIRDEQEKLISKRFTDAELAAELWFMKWVRCAARRASDVGGPSKVDNERLASLRRFASLPHYDEKELNDD